MNENVKEVFEWIYCIIIALVLALLFRYFIGTPTVVQQRSMYPTLKESQRLLLNRTFRITGKDIKVGDIITFEAPSESFTRYNVSQSNPVAKYDYEFDNLFQKFMYYVIEKTKTSYIKRVVAVEGNHVEIKDNKIYINGNELEEEYLSDDVVTESQVFTDFIVPEGYIFAVGDNRTKSKDCRELGCIPVEKVEGIVVLRFWPLDVFGKVN